MTELSHLVHPTRCFCQIPDSEIRPWVIKRYVEQQSTVDLIRSTNDPREKEIISMVALFEVDDDTMLDLMDNAGMSEQHILHCRQVVMRILGIDALGG